MESKELIQELRSDAEWAHANEWETPITLSDHLDAAADEIEALLSEVERQSAEIASVTAERDEARDAICRHCMDVPCREAECEWWRGYGKEQNDG